MLLTSKQYVKIVCNEQSTSLKVTPTTTVLNLIQAAAEELSEVVNVSHSTLLESYHPLDLERRLRAYENVHDIMNTWDNDQQNTLTIKSLELFHSDHDFSLSDVPENKPSSLTVTMYHSQRVGKWNRRFITFLSEGHVLISKRADSKIADKDLLARCHLEHFEIYTPTPDGAKKAMKSSRRLCLALKSQYRSNFFEDGADYVHYFSTDDDDIAEKWCSTIQQWRSWHLIDRLSKDDGGKDNDDGKNNGSKNDGGKTMTD